VPVATEPPRGPEPLHRRLLRIDVIGGVLITLIALVALAEALKLELGVMRSFGPGMVPTLVAGILLLSGVLVLGFGIVRPAARTEWLSVSLRGPVTVVLAMLVFAATVRGLALGPLVLPQLGLAVAGPLTVLIAGRADPGTSLRELAALGFGLTGVSLMVFVDGLSLPLPSLPGPLESATITWPGQTVMVRVVYLAYFVVTAAILRFVPARDPQSPEAPGV